MFEVHLAELINISSSLECKRRLSSPKEGLSSKGCVDAIRTETIDLSGVVSHGEHALMKQNTISSVTLVGAGKGD